MLETDQFLLSASRWVQANPSQALMLLRIVKELKPNPLHEIWLQDTNDCPHYPYVATNWVVRVPTEFRFTKYSSSYPDESKFRYMPPTNATETELREWVASSQHVAISLCDEIEPGFWDTFYHRIALAKTETEYVDELVRRQSEHATRRELVERSMT